MYEGEWLAGEINGTNLYLGWVRGDEKYLKMDSDKVSMQGIVTARQCGHCGHHEIGVTTDTHEYIALKPGMKVEIHE